MKNFRVTFSSETWFHHILLLQSAVEAEIICIFASRLMWVTVCVSCSWWCDKDIFPNRVLNITPTDGMFCLLYSLLMFTSSLVLILQTLLLKNKNLMLCTVQLSCLTCCRYHRPPLPNPSTRSESRWSSETVFYWGLKLLQSIRHMAACRRGERKRWDSWGKEKLFQMIYMSYVHFKRLYY